MVVDLFRRVGPHNGCRSSLIPSAMEETLRYEALSPVQARYVARDTELYGTP